MNQEKETQKVGKLPWAKNLLGIENTRRAKNDGQPRKASITLLKAPRGDRPTKLISSILEYVASSYLPKPHFCPRTLSFKQTSRCSVPKAQQNLPFHQPHQRTTRWWRYYISSGVSAEAPFHEKSRKFGI